MVTKLSIDVIYQNCIIPKLGEQFLKMSTKSVHNNYCKNLQNPIDFTKSMKTSVTQKLVCKVLNISKAILTALTGSTALPKFYLRNSGRKRKRPLTLRL